MKKLKIHQLGKIISGGTPSTTNENYWDGEVIWITPKDLSKNKSRYIYNGERNITQAGLEHSSAKLLPVNSVLLSSRAPIGYLAIAGCELTTNQGFKSVICDESIVIPEYLYYSLSTKIDDLISISSGSTFLELSKSSFENFELNIHSIQKQQHIVNIIGSIDDLIEHKNLIINKINQLKKYLYFKSIAKSQDESTLKNYINIETGSMNLNENDPNGEYIFYTRNEGTFKANKYTHNQTGVIVAGEGNFTPKYANGKFGLHQRAYLLSSNSDLLSDEILLQIVSSNVDYLNSVAVGSTVKSLRRNSFENMPFYIDGKYDEIKNVLFKLQKLENEYIHLINKLNNTKQIYLKKFFG